MSINRITNVKITTDEERMFGTSDWCGTVAGRPALLMSYYNGAALWVFDGKWKREQTFPDLREAYKRLGVSDER